MWDAVQVDWGRDAEGQMEEIGQCSDTGWRVDRGCYCRGGIERMRMQNCRDCFWDRICGWPDHSRLDVPSRPYRWIEL
jgi:hypothetical protein